MNDKKTSLIIFVVSVLAGALFTYLSADRNVPQTAPATKADQMPSTMADQKWRIGYYEGGYYDDYEGGLRALVDGLAELEWIEPLDIPEFEPDDDTQVIWEYLAQNVQSPYIQFVADAYWSADWDETQRQQNRRAAIQRLNTIGDIDVMIAMGTWAGQDLATDEHAVPTMAINSSGPVQAGIIDSVTDSGLDHVVAECDPDRYVRQIQLFHDIVGFERLGVVHDNTADGKIYANLTDLQRVGADRDFEVIECYARDTGFEERIYRQELINCYQELAPQIDALWIGVHQGEDPVFMPEILEPLFAHDVATWAQAGLPAVKRGALISITQQDYAAAGRWYAQTLAKILNGAQPRDLNQVFELPNHVIINLETARRINFELPAGLLEIADQTFDTIEGE